MATNEARLISEHARLVDQGVDGCGLSMHQAIGMQDAVRLLGHEALADKLKAHHRERLEHALAHAEGYVRTLGGS